MTTLRCRPVCAALLLAAWAMAVPCRAEQAPREQVLSGVDELLRVLEEYKLPYDAADVRRKALDAVVAAVDPLGRVVDADTSERLAAARLGRVNSVGIRISFTNDRPQVVDVYEGTPAAEVGLQIGDVILTIEDQDTTNLYHSGAVSMLRGPATETVHLVVQAVDGMTNEWDVGRSEITVPALETTEALSETICYLKLNGLYPGSGAEVAALLANWQAAGMFGVVIDLRGANGGDADTVQVIASAFAQEGDFLFSFRDKDDQDLAVYKAVPGPTLDMPVMLLADAETTGAAEVLAAVLKGSTRGVMLLGSPTEGSLLIRETLELPAGDRILLATKRLALADGTVFRGQQGVKPDIMAKTDTATYEPEITEEAALKEEKEHQRLRHRVRNDAVLRRAVDVLLGLKALNIRSGSVAPYRDDQ